MRIQFYLLCETRIKASLRQFIMKGFKFNKKVQGAMMKLIWGKYV